MRIPLLMVLVLGLGAVDAPLLIPLGSADLEVTAGAHATAVLAQARHQRGLAAMRAGQNLHQPLTILVLIRVTGGAATVSIRPTAGGEPLVSGVFAVGDGVLRLPQADALDLAVDATTTAAGPVQVTAVVYGDFLQRDILKALEAGADEAREVDPQVEQDPALRPFLAEANNLKQILTAMVAYQTEFIAWPLAEIAAAPMPPQTPEQARLLTAAAFELLARRMQLPSRLFVSPFTPERALPPPRSEAEISARPDPAWAEDYAYDWSVPMEPASYRVVIASRRFAQHPRLGLGVTAVCADSSIRFLLADPAVEVHGLSTAGLAGFGDDLLPAVPNPDAAGAEDREGAGEAPGLPDNIFDDHGDGAAGAALQPGKGDPRRAFVK